MSDRTPPEGYSLAQIVIHWTIAALIIFQLAFNKAMQAAFDDKLDGGVVDDPIGAWLHASVGLAVLALACLRLGIRFTRGAPAAHRDKAQVLVWVGYATHLMLYVFIFAMPLTGALAWFFVIEMAAELHEIGRLVLIPVIGLHVLGALAEHFVFNNDSLMRMMRPARKSGGREATTEPVRNA